MGILDTLFGGGNKNNAMNAANQYYDQIPGVGHETYDPYINQGQESGNNAHMAYDEMLKDPQAFINKIMGGYQESDAYKYNADKLGRGMSNTAAMGGFAGTPMDQMNQAEGVQKLLSGDQEKWLQDVLGRYDRGLSGEEIEATRGFNAAEGLGGMIGNNLANKGGLAFNDQQQKAKNRTDMINQLIKALGTVGGAALGGPAGAMFGGGSAGPMSGSPFAPWKNPG